MANERVLMVGAGGISTVWFPIIAHEELKLCGVVDLDEETARKRLEEYSVDAPVYTDVEKALTETAPDFVLDLTTPGAHCTVTCAALNKGIPVIGEKPMAENMEQARQMVKAAEDNDTLYMVSQSRRWNPNHATIAHAVRNGDIGKLTTLNCDFYIGAHFGGFRDEMDSPLILDMAIHLFDLARLFSGASATHVYAYEFNPHGSWYKGDVAASCIFEMDDGSVFTFRGSWCAEGCPTSWNGNWRIIGDKGTMMYENDNKPYGEIVKGSDGFQFEVEALDVQMADMPYGEMHGAMREMLAYLRTGEMPATECHDNIHSLSMVMSAIESAKQKKRIPVTV